MGVPYTWSGSCKNQPPFLRHANNHFRKSTKCAPAASKVLQNRDKSKQLKLVSQMMQSGSGGAAAVKNVFSLTPQECALTKVMRWYIYGKPLSSSSSSSLRDECMYV